MTNIDPMWGAVILGIVSILLLELAVWALIKASMLKKQERDNYFIAPFDKVRIIRESMDDGELFIEKDIDSDDLTEVVVFVDKLKLKYPDDVIAAWNCFGDKVY